MSPTLTAPGGAGRSPLDVPVQARLLPGRPPPSGRRGGPGAAGSEDSEAASEGRRWRGAVDDQSWQVSEVKFCRLRCLVCCMSVLALCQLGQVLMVPQCIQSDPHSVQA